MSVLFSRLQSYSLHCPDNHYKNVLVLFSELDKGQLMLSAGISLPELIIPF